MAIIKWVTDNNSFCWCGLPAKKEIGTQKYCQKHFKPKEVRNKIGRYSGKSKSPNRFNDYQ